MRRDATVRFVRVAIFAVLVALLTRTYADPDLWGHILAGREIASRGIPPTDPYSFTSDHPWMNPNWLGELLMYGAWRAGGAAGLVTLKLALILGTLGVVLAALRRSGTPALVTDVLAALWAISVYASTQTARPHLFSFLGFALLLALLDAASEGRRRALLVVPALLLLWANLHGSWPIALGVFGLWSLCDGIPSGPGRAIERTISVAVVGLSLLATLGTPYGLTLWRFLLDAGASGHAEVTEWHPVLDVSVGRTVLWVAVAAAASVGLFASPRRPAPFVWLVVLGFGVASFRVARLGMFFSTAVVVLLAPQFAALAATRPRESSSRRPPTALARIVVVGMAACILAVAAASAYRDIRCIRMTYEWGPDTRAAAFIQRNELRGRLLTWVDWGEYATWWFAPDLLVSIDPRRETVYSKETIEAHHDLYFAAPGWAAYLQRLQPDYAWLPKSLPIVAHLDPGSWVRIFDGAESLVLAKSPGRAFVTPPGHDRPWCFPGDPGEQGR